MRTSALRRISPYRDERGFTLAELLVVVLMIAILLVIIMPTYLDQRAKGEDTEAKHSIKTAATALMTHYVAAQTFDASTTDLVAIEPALGEARELLVSGDVDSYELSERSASDTRFTLAWADDGTMTRTCSHPGYGLCHEAADADGNWW